MHVTDVFHKPLLSHRTSQQTLFLQCSGERQNVFEKLQYHPAPHTPNVTFIHTYNHSFTVLSAKSINTVSLPWKLSDFMDTAFSWTLSFPLGPYFSFLWGPFSFILLLFVGLHHTVTTRLISGRACLGVSTIKSAALTFPPPRVNLLVPVPAATYNTCSAHN